MLNKSCDFEQPSGFSTLHIISTSISVPIYIVAFWILIFKSPVHFSKYRNYLVAHVFSGLLLELHMGTIWKVTIILPIPIMCSNSPLAEYAPILFQLLFVCFVYTGISAQQLFLYRMEAVVIFQNENSRLKKLVTITKFGFYIGALLITLFAILIYPDLKYQKSYKMKMEQRFGTFSGYMWCDNCFFMNFDSNIFKIFYLICGIGTVMCFSSSFSAFTATIRYLNSVKIKLSVKTAALHRNFLHSLILTITVHIICILCPVLIFLGAISVVVELSQFPYIPYILLMIIQEHGAASTVTMFLTNNLLRQTIRKMLPVRQLEAVSTVSAYSLTNAL
ncbi:Serpentine Receptor, class H [Caenorhabditis elegans]|uniref:Serpentine Receptor, class H n=1 Tax=Caenorhabditis elegans TaxID=6239 RepID=Q9TXK5_CAEEL|nr:Serpentine Receptor, class H [Caenorhabditis elegans]CCD72647.1 Serpentine Receptor, class H [Caenorhabditis elegans]|eukprot:NP_503482.1 Serpentine Receptor, class H [Caenorhabditis elegans]